MVHCVVYVVDNCNSYLNFGNCLLVIRNIVVDRFVFLFFLNCFNLHWQQHDINRFPNNWDISKAWRQVLVLLKEIHGRFQLCAKRIKINIFQRCNGQSTSWGRLKKIDLGYFQGKFESDHSCTGDVYNYIWIWIYSDINI